VTVTELAISGRGRMGRQKPAVAPGDELTGSYFDEEVVQTIAALSAAADTLLLGRATYEGFAAYFSFVFGFTRPLAPVPPPRQANRRERAPRSPAVSTACHARKTRATGVAAQ
jgi:hypothetical protein